MPSLAWLFMQWIYGGIWVYIHLHLYHWKTSSHRAFHRVRIKILSASQPGFRNCKVTTYLSRSSQRKSLEHLIKVPSATGRRIRVTLTRDSLGLVSMCDALLTHTTDLLMLSDDLLIQRDLAAPHPGNNRLTLTEKGKTRNEDALYFFQPFWETTILR